MKLEPLTLEQCQRVRTWRNAEMEVWRTPFMLTESMQSEFYYEKVSNRHSGHRYWAIVGEQSDEINMSMTPENPCIRTLGLDFIGMGGITYIQWENRIGEITLIVNPEFRRYNLGEKAVDLLLDQAFNHLNLQTVFGEVYDCNKAGYKFWWKIADRYKSACATLYHRKYWQGQYYNSMYFSIDKDDFNNSNKQG